MQPQKQKVINVIKRLGLKLTAADAAAGAGISLPEARIELNRIAWETHGSLEVAKTGDILYGFSPTFTARYEAAEWREALNQILGTVKDIVFYVVKCSFGILLICSFLTIAVVFLAALLFILFGVDAADGQLDDLEADLDMDYFDFGDLWLFFAWAVFTGGATPESHSDRYLGMKVDAPDNGFFFNCYSFLFGDGNPNRDLDHRQWQCIAEVIRRSGGAVVAEELLPYDRKGITASALALECLVKFDGIPEVSEEGEIIYVFPGMQVSGHHRIFFDLPEYLEESPWKFSDLPTSRLHWVFFFAGSNLCGAYALKNHLSWFPPLQPFGMQVNFIMTYAVFFLGFPICRQILNTGRNAMIDLRNGKRKQQRAYLGSKEGEKKLAGARAFAQKRFVITRNDICFTTEEDSLAQQFIDTTPPVAVPSSPENIGSQS